MVASILCPAKRGTLTVTATARVLNGPIIQYVHAW